jgi:hypothetical protein
MNTNKFGHTSTLVTEIKSVFVFGGAVKSNTQGPQTTNQLLLLSLGNHKILALIA